MKMVSWLADAAAESGLTGQVDCVRQANKISSPQGEYNLV